MDHCQGPSIEIDVGILKEQIKSITSLCNKMDTVIEKLIESHERTTENIYDSMEEKRKETQSDIKEIHSRITTVDKNLSEKIETTERRIMEEIKSLKQDIIEHNTKEDNEMRKLLEWKWMVVGAMFFGSWLISNLRLDHVMTIFK